MRFAALSLVLLLSGCNSATAPNVSVEGRLTRIGIAIDASINAVVDIAKLVHSSGRITQAEYNSIIKSALEITEIQQNELIPALREIESMPTYSGSREKAIEVINVVISRLPELHKVEDAAMYSELYVKVGEAYKLTLELIEEVR